ncbi:E1-E2 ATPase-domain-containing protein, partial [Blyttiomyces helicus]
MSPPPPSRTAFRQPRDLVASKVIARASLHVPLPGEQRPYVAPLGVFYALWLYIRIFRFEEYLGSPEFAWLSLFLIVAVNILFLLVGQWSVAAGARLTCRKEPDPYRAETIVIIPTAHNGSGALCKLERTPVVGSSRPQLYFFFQKKKYIFDDESGVFKKLDFPSHHGYTMTEYRVSKGLATEKEIKAATEKYGLNKFDIPIPSFQELFKEHIVAPFFIFQMFCVALWFLDEMWYYSLFTLFMLFVFESTVVFQRLKNLQEFRSMSIKPYPINVYRLEKWSIIQTDELLPGDIVSIVRQKDDSPVPADLIVLDGSCIANEAMLSGESTPQLKESVQTREPTDIFKLSSDKNNVLFGGTKVLQVTPPAKGQRLVAPDGGAIASVLRTGFTTQQGKLVRTIIYSTERITANNLESLLFILFLVFFAVIASWYVWVEGTKNEDRKRSKVLLDCILIITSVVPAELPMELSLAVNNSLIALVRAFIYCTEPFRIPF